MSDPFVHLRVASGYSLQYGASHPSELVAVAVAHEMDTLALTDRDGLYGSIRFAKACLSAGLAPIVGVDFALALPGRGDRAGGRTGGDGERGATSLAARREARPTPKPVRGGELRDPRLPRVVVYASSRAGWASLCRLTSAVHLAGERGKPVLTPELVARHADDLIVLLGSDSDLGNALATGGPDAAEWALARWREVLSPEQLAVGVTNHRLPGRGIGSAAHAGRMLSFADSHRLVGVLTNDVRMADKRRATTVDVLDAARRLVPLDLRNVDRRNAEGYLKSGKEMLAAAEEAALSAGRPDAERLFADTRTLAIRTRLDPRADIGLGEIHLPEFSALGVSGEAESAFAALRQRCEAGINSHYGTTSSAIETRLDDELRVIKTMGFASYFLTVAEVVGMIKDMGIRVAARGSGAGSLVNYLLGVSGVDPLRYGLIMERFLSPLRQALPDIDIDVESARRTEIYDRILDAFGGERVACVAMVETYRVRHAIRDVGAALSLPPGEIDAIAKSFPHIRARDARSAIRDLPELRSAGLGSRRLDVLFELVESLDGLPRHLALHPCGVLLSDATLLDRTPVEASFGGYPMSQFDKDDVEDMGLLKLDVLGIRMQSSMAHALEEIIRIEDHCPDIDALAPFDDPQVYDVIAHRNTLGCFQIESPGQRELIGKFGPSTFLDVIIDISLFRPGPVKSDMITPFLEARHGWAKVRYPHPDLEPVLRDTGGVVVFHEQIIQIVSVMTGCTLAEGDEARRALGDRIGQAEVKRWFFPAARRKGYAEPLIERVWGILESFASFGFCKAHAAAFALPTYQSAWLKTHYPAHFLAGVLTHDPGMYPKRLILEEARRCGVEILALDVNESSDAYRAIRLGEAPRESRLGGREVAWADGRREAPDGREEAWADGRGEPPDGPEEAWPDGLPDGRGYGIRLSLSDVKGITATEVGRIVAGQPYASLTDFANRTGCAAPVVERLVLAGAFDDLYGVGRAIGVAPRDRITRRDLLLTVADLERAARVDRRLAGAGRARGLAGAGRAKVSARGLRPESDDPWQRAQGQALATPPPRPVEIQLPLDFSTPPLTETPPSTEDGAYEGWTGGASGPGDVVATGLPEMTDDERLAAELEIVGLDATRHALTDYLPFLRTLGVTFAADLLGKRWRSDLLIAGVKVATQTPAVRSGRRVVFLTLDDTTGPSDATFFEDAQGPYAATVFGSWLLVVRGELRRTGPRGVSLRATAAWDLPQLYALYTRTLDEGGGEAEALAAVVALMTEVPEGFGMVGEQLTDEQLAALPPESRPDADAQQHGKGGGMGRRRTLVHASGFAQSPYADVKAAEPTRKLWHSSPGSSGR